MVAMVLFAFFLYFPYAWCALRGESPAWYGLHWRLSGAAARDVAIVSIGTLVPLTFISCAFFSQSLPAHAGGQVFAGILSGLAAAVAEETFFRGWVQSILSRRMSAWESILLASALFGLAHVFRSPAAMLAFFPGLFMGFLRHRHASVLPAILFHWVGNIWSIWFYPYL